MKKLFILLFLVFYTIICNGQCITPNPNAGTDDSICGKTYILQGSLPDIGNTGMWSQISGPIGSTSVFSNPNSNTSQVAVNIYGLYTFKWYEFVDTCFGMDTVQIKFILMPNPDAGPDTSVCGKYVHLHAIAGSGNHGIWSSVPSGTSWWDTPNGSPGPNYALFDTVWARWPSPNDTIKFIWTEYNNICVAKDSIYVYFASLQPAIHLVSLADSVNCGLSFTRLDAQQPAYGKGFWIDTVPNTHYYPGPIPGHVNCNPDSVVAAIYGMHHFYWITRNGECSDTSNVIPVRFIPIPHANAGIKYWPGLFGSNSEIKTDTTCGYTYYLDAVPSIGTGMWSCQDAPNTWFNQYGQGAQTSSIHNDTVNTSILTYYTNPPYKQLIWIENYKGCVDADTLRLMFAPIPTGAFISTMPSCRGDSSVIIADTDPWNANNYGLTHFYWSLDTTARYDSDTTHLINQDTIVVRWARGSKHIVRLITENKYGCFSGIITDTIKEPAPFNNNYTVYPATCHLSNGEIILDNENNTYQFTWDTTFAISHRHDTLQTGLQNKEYTILVDGESVSPDAQPGTFCTDTLKIFIPDTGEVTAMFDTTYFVDTMNTLAPLQVNFYNQSIGAINYHWVFYDTDGNIIGNSFVENPTYIFNEGIYRIVLIAESNFCKDTFIYRYLHVRNTIKYNLSDKFYLNIFPNPNKGLFTIELYSPVNDNFNFKIVNALGQEIFNHEFIINWKVAKIVDLHEFESGIYFIILKSNNGIDIKRKVVKL